MNTSNIQKVAVNAATQLVLTHPRTRIYNHLMGLQKSQTCRMIVEALAKEGYNAGSVQSTISDMKNQIELDVISGTGKPKDPEFLFLTPGAVRHEGRDYFPRPPKQTALQKANQQYHEEKDQLMAKINLINATPKASMMGGNTLQSEVLRLHKGEEALKLATAKVADLAGTVTEKEFPKGLQILWRGQKMSVGELKEMYNDLKMLSKMFE